jgi:hypothetical protein
MVLHNQVIKNSDSDFTAAFVAAELRKLEMVC